MLPQTDRNDRPHLLRLSGLTLGVVAALGLMLAGSCELQIVLASSDSGRIATPGKVQPHTWALLVEYHETFLRDQDPDSFRQKVSGRYNEATLGEILQGGDPRARRAAVQALGLFGSYASNPTVARALRDSDPTVRVLADDSLWLIWFRADTPENNDALKQVQRLINRGRLDQAIERANELIARSPNFAEAYNQRAIAQCFSGRFAESIEDCRKVLAHNPFHIGALGGMGQCQLRLGLRNDALETFRRAVKLQPYNEGLKAVIAELEAANR